MTATAAPRVPARRRGLTFPPPAAARTVPPKPSLGMLQSAAATVATHTVREGIGPGHSGDAVPHYILESDWPKVSLTESEFWTAHRLAGVRQTENLWAGRMDRYGAQNRDGWGLHIVGVTTEMAFAKHLGAYYDGSINRLRQADGTAADDVKGGYQVRSRKPVRLNFATDAALILHEEDADDRACVLVLGPYFKVSSEGMRTVDCWLAGWLWAREGKKGAYWEPEAPHPAFFVPAADLHPMSELPPPR